MGPSVNPATVGPAFFLHRLKTTRAGADRLVMKMAATIALAILALAVSMTGDRPAGRDSRTITRIEVSR